MSPFMMFTEDVLDIDNAQGKMVASKLMTYERNSELLVKLTLNDVTLRPPTGVQDTIIYPGWWP